MHPPENTKEIPAGRQKHRKSAANWGFKKSIDSPNLGYYKAHNCVRYYVIYYYLK